MYPTLPKSYKGVYPFKLGTTSFIYPDHIIPNVRMLGPHLDEIELLFFESRPASLPSPHEIEEIGLLAEEFDLSYNVHLPLDISLSASDPSMRQAALETILQIIDLTRPLSPSTCTLHLPYNGIDSEPEQIKKWQKLVCQSLEQLLAFGIESKSISIETLDYPFEWVDNILIDLSLSVCIDLGHLMVHGFEPLTVFDRYSQITSIIHLHGVENNKDHLALDRLSDDKTDAIMGILKRFTGVVSLEVFSYNRLVNSLIYLENCWQLYGK